MPQTPRAITGRANSRPRPRRGANPGRSRGSRLVRRPSRVCQQSGDSLRNGSAGRSASWEVLRQHAAQLGAVAIAVFLLMKTYSVSQYSLTTASALLTSAPLAVVLGTLTSYEYAMWPLLSVASGTAATVLWRREGWSVSFLLTTGLSVAAALLSPPGYLAVGVLLLLAVCIGQAALVRLTRERSEKWRRWVPSRPAAVSSALIAVTLAALVYSLPNAWLPAELVVFHGANDERRAVVGHVMSSDDGWLTVLRGGDRGLTRLRSEDLVTRRVCHLAGAQSKAKSPLILVLQRKPYASPNLGCRSLLASLPQAALIEGSFPDSHPYRGR
jgi:hypothetical protein